MSPTYDARRLEALLAILLDSGLSETEKNELNSLLQASAAARAHYRKSVHLHMALIRHQPDVKIIPFKSRRLPATILAVGIAACLMLGGFFWLRAPVAILSGSTAAVWNPATSPSHLLGKRVELLSGFAELSYRSGVRVILQGPCHFTVTAENSIQVTHGRATVKVPHHLNGFHLDTPAGRITDLGTEFGVAVGSSDDGPVILTEVFDGEIEIPAENAPRKRMVSGDSLAILHEVGGTRLVSTMGDYPVNLADSARKLPQPSSQTRSPGNLALGKPVTCKAFYSRPQGSVFPPSNLTDGQFNDSGSPGDWSFWLAPNGEDGEFTVDLLTNHLIGSITLQNTHNRIHGDRGMKDFIIETSEDGVVFQEILRATLEPIINLPAPGVDFPFQSFRFPPTTARYVKIVGLSHYRNPTRADDTTNQGGGLNEIQIFAP